MLLYWELCPQTLHYCPLQCRRKSPTVSVYNTTLPQVVDFILFVLNFFKPSLCLATMHYPKQKSLFLPGDISYNFFFQKKKGMM